MIVFLTSGLWHGASLTFIVWGGLNGLFQVIGEILKPMKDKTISALHLNKDSLGYEVVHIICTFVLVDFSWIFFRAKSISDAFEIIKSIITAKFP